MKLKILLILFIVIIISFIFTKNNHKEIYTIEPQIVQKEHKIPSSKIDLSIKLKTQMLAQELSNQLPHSHLLNNIKVTKDSWLNALITREDNLQLHVQNNALYLNFGINIKGTLHYKKYFFKAKSKFTIHANVTALIDVEVNKNWKLQAKSIKVSIEMHKAKTSLYGVKISLKSILNKEIKKRTPILNKIIKKAINKISIKEEMSKIWKDMHLIHKIKNEKVWFHFVPKNIIFNKKYEHNDTIVLCPSMIGKCMLFTDKEKIIKHSKVTLPNLEKKGITNNAFHIKLPIELNYEELSHSLIKKMNQKEILFNGFEIKIEDIEFIPSNDTIIMIINFHSHFYIDWFNTKGTLIFKGKPEYNLKNHQLMINNLDYHLDINERIISFASLFWHDMFKAEIEKNLIYELSQSNNLIHNYKNILNQKIESIQVSKEINLKGKIDTLALDDIYLTYSDIVVVLKILGDMNLSYSPQKAF